MKSGLMLQFMKRRAIEAEADLPPQVEEKKGHYKTVPHGKEVK